jgi:hypothetical protein
MGNSTSNPGAVEWRLYISHGRARIAETSCCGAYEWACEGGEYLVLRPRKGGGHEEAGRGRYVDARLVWNELVIEHRRGHQGSGSYGL